MAKRISSWIQGTNCIKARRVNIVHRIAVDNNPVRRVFATILKVINGACFREVSIF